MSVPTPKSVEALVELWRTSDTEETRAAEINVAEERLREVCRDLFGHRRDGEAGR